MLLSKIPLLSAHEIIKILAHFGFKPLRQTGSHIHLVHDENRRLVTVPNHMEIAVGTLLAILKAGTYRTGRFLTPSTIISDVLPPTLGDCTAIRYGPERDSVAQ